MLADVRFALRGLAQRPGFTAVALATLAIGIGANAAVFSIAQAVLLRPLPFREPDRLVLVWERNVARDRQRNVVNPGNYLAWRERSPAFEAIAAFTSGSRNVSGDGAPVRIDVGGVTANFFDTLGVGPALGRAFVEDDGRPGAADVALLSDALWRGRFAADPGVLGRSVTLNGTPTTIVGVMPPDFAVPPGSEAWLPLTIGEGGLQRDSRGRSLMAIARLRPGVEVAQAQAAMDVVARQTVAERPEFNTGWDVFVAPLHADLVRDVRPALLVLAGAVGLVLLIGCGNLATLLLARALGREREIAIRRALGAGTGRLVTQLLTESLVLAVGGGALGLLLAAGLTRALLAIVPPEVVALFHPAVDARVLSFAALASVASAVLFGLVPAAQTVRPDLVRSLREGGAGSGLSGGRRRLARLVVAGEVALAVVLLAGAGVLLRSFARLSSVDAGFEPERVLSMQVTLAGDRYEGERAPRFYADALARIGALPGVESAAAISFRPFAVGSATRFALPDRPAPAAGEEPVAEVRMVSAGLFRTLGLPLKEGRDFDARDVAGAPQVVIVNEHVARTSWPGRSAIGQRIGMQWGGPLDAEIVGVAADARLVGLETPPRATLYWPVAQVRMPSMTLLVRAAAGEPGALAGPVRQAIASLDPELPVAKVTPLAELRDGNVARPRFVMLLVGAFAGTAALLAALGLFGVLSYSVAQRLPEMGVRLALGARPRDVASLVVREGMATVAAGGVAGLAAALVLLKLLERLLFQTGARDPLALAGVVAVLGLVGLAAVWLPARRASRVDPSAVLRAE